MALAHFPADRRRADIKRCAQALLDLQGEEANRFWRAEMAQLAKGLMRQGASGEEVSHQAGLFMNAVQMELQNLFAEEEERALDARA
ncbi:hypothetical protein J2858_002123 [Neorhizobium galegae]|uniref:DUF6074 family protein n=1 Tax=Rhizobium/Agrobacterium group TaxID=227290 RepID=UPI001AE245CB|nr:DUF6074 family protein [Neorhizobium galegae]MBP2549200.1 hypothetical protein [Neorhizobium galegae]